ncbi:hypothetical protein [Vibrio metschnikovii]|uniref:hypothetical protein n=1 Tax=Vibrio metschnikovii TaxID=28172 RepID=UPI002FC7ECB6
MDSIIDLIKFIEKYPVTGAAICGLVVAGVIGIVKVIAATVSERKKQHYIKPNYFGLSKDFYITTVLEFFPDDSPAGYNQKQYSRPDLWEIKVEIVSHFVFFHKIVPKNKDDILSVMVRKNGKEKMVNFNRSI